MLGMTKREEIPHNARNDRRGNSPMTIGTFANEIIEVELTLRD